VDVILSPSNEVLETKRVGSYLMRSGKHGSIYALRETVNLLVEQGDIDQALRLIHDFVERIITEPICTSQVFGSQELDYLCRAIGKANLIGIMGKISEAATNQQNQPVFTYIVTKLQKSGGHTRVIEDFIEARPNAQHIILSTELEGKSEATYLTNSLNKKANIVFERAQKGNYQQRLTWLQKRLLQLNPKKVYLFNHQQDSVGTAAIQPEMKLDGTFYHHADHHLCLGVYLSHLEHIDPHPMGYHNCRDLLGIDNTYIPLTIDDKGERPADRPFLHEGVLTTCTAARSNKIEIPYFISYLEIVPKVLQSTRGRHIHIGRLSPWALFKIRRGLKRCGIEAKRFIYIPWVSSVWNALQEFQVDLYIASFPYGGGLTLIEAMGAGVPVALHRHMFSRVLSGIDLAYPGAFSWCYPDELLLFCSNVSKETLAEHSQLARKQYENFHRREILEQALGKSTNMIFPPKLSPSFTHQVDEWACWIERQLTFKRLVRRGAYRLFRRFRARFL
jgi:hypothetical protein